MVQSSETDAPIFPPSDLLSDEPPLETYRHLKQIILLLTSLERLWQARQDFFAGANLSIYYSTCQPKSEDVRDPDLFVVLDTERKERKSWVVWAEDGKYPNFILEILSDMSSKTKKELRTTLLLHFNHSSAFSSLNRQGLENLLTFLQIEPKTKQVLLNKTFSEKSVKELVAFLKTYSTF